jgi:hypothetical protein
MSDNRKKPKDGLSDISDMNSRFSDMNRRFDQLVEEIRKSKPRNP